MLYERIKELCKKRGTSVAEMERALGFARSSVSKIDKHVPSADKLQKIADYLGVTIDSLMDGVPNIGPQNDTQWYINEETARIAQEIYEDPNKRALFYAARDSRPEDLKMAADMLERFKETNPDG